MLDLAKIKKFVDQCWDDEIVPTLVEYIKIPNKSPAFDPDWAAHGYMDEAVALFERWARAKLPLLPGSTLEVVRLPGRTPVIVIDVPGEGEDKVLSERPQRICEKGAPSRSWPCSVRSSRKRSSSLPGCWAPTQMRMAQTNSCTFLPASAFRSSSRRSSPTIMPRRGGFKEFLCYAPLLCCLFVGGVRNSCDTLQHRLNIGAL